MAEKTFHVPSISCNHCVMTLERELSGLDGVTAVSASAEDKTVSVTWEAPADRAAIVSLLEEINYPPAG